MRTLASGLVALALSPAAAGYVVPQAFANVSDAGVAGPIRDFAHTYQWLIHEVELTGLVGQDLSAIRYRRPGNGSAGKVPWSTSAVSCTNYEVRIGRGVEPVLRSGTFALNAVGAQTMVRTGPLAFEPGALPASPPLAPFGAAIEFDQPWHYAGGNLLIEVRHTGFGPQGAMVIDAVWTGTMGWGGRFAALSNSGFGATTGIQRNFAIIDLVPVPAPATAALLAGVPMVFCPRRRRERPA